jgi:hypothetical protein
MGEQEQALQLASGDHLLVVQGLEGCLLLLPQQRAQAFLGREELASEPQQAGGPLVPGTQKASAGRRERCPVLPQSTERKEQGKDVSHSARSSLRPEEGDSGMPRLVVKPEWGTEAL